MSSEEIDAFRSELLRQKIIFEAELRRQRESFEERLAAVAQELAAREADCRNLQSVITVLGKKVDAVAEQVTRRPPTPRRMPTPTRTPSLIGDDELIKPPQNLGNTSARRPFGNASAAAPSPSSTNHGNGINTFLRRPSPLISVGSPSTITVMHRVPSLLALSRSDSPARSNADTNGGSAHVDPHPSTTTTTTTASAARTPSGVHPHRPLSQRKASNGNSARNSVVDEDHEESTRDIYTSGGRTPLANASPRTVRGRRRSSSLKAKKRNTSAHRLMDVKATDDW